MSPCSDKVTLTGSSGLVFTAEYQNTAYELTVLGFTTDPALPTEIDFIGQETAVTQIQLMASLSEQSLVVADAGPDQTVDDRTTVTLDGTGSQGEGLTYSWTQLSGPAVALVGADTATPSFEVPDLDEDATLEFQLTVTGTPYTTSDTVTVFVVDANVPPVADAGPDQTVEQTSPGGATVTLDGSGSTDADEDALTYTWTGSFGSAEGVSPSVALAAGTHEITLEVSDGEAVATDTVTVVVQDTIAPTISAQVTPDANAAGWRNGEVTVTFTCEDDGSGVASCPAAVVLGEGASQSVTGTVTDEAGNEASVTVDDINVDLTAPTVTFAGNNGAYGVDEVISITCEASDGLSGVASDTCEDMTVEAWTLGTGTHTLTAAATDRAGNTGSSTVTFTVGASEQAICALVQDWVSNPGQRNSLCMQVERNVKAFINHVRAQADKHLTVEQAETLIRLANDL